MANCNDHQTYEHGNPKFAVFLFDRSVGVLAYFLLTSVSPFLAENKALTLSNITQMKIDYPPHLFEVVSPLALDFIRSLIKRNPRQESPPHPPSFFFSRLFWGLSDFLLLF